MRIGDTELGGLHLMWSVQMACAGRLFCASWCSSSHHGVLLPTWVLLAIPQHLVLDSCVQIWTGMGPSAVLAVAACRRLSLCRCSGMMSCGSC